MDRIFLSKADVTRVEEEFVLDALRSGWIAPLGPHVDAFEAEVAERVGVSGALALSSGTAALHLALLGVGARPGTVVVVPSMTFAASANAVAYTGAQPVFVDSLATDGNVDPELLLHAVDTLQSEGTEVAAAMTVDLFGRCADYPSIESALEQRGVPLIEDAAEALGASLRGAPAGRFGRAAALSFNGNKIVSTSGGGMLLSNDEELISRARYLSTQARATGAVVRAHRGRLQLPDVEHPGGPRAWAAAQTRRDARCAGGRSGRCMSPRSGRFRGYVCSARMPSAATSLTTAG